jgi:uncharacterized protein involved in exopolysaccharide biosynthesis
MAVYSDIVYSSVREVLYVLFRHKGKILLFFLLVSAGVILATYAWPKSYASESKLLVRIGRESLPSDPAVQGAMLNVTQDRTPEVRSIIALLSSYDLVEDTVDFIGEGWILDRPDLPRNENLAIDIPEDRAWIAAVKQIVRVPVNLGKSLLVTLSLREDLSPREEAIKTVMNGLTVDVEKQTNIVLIQYEAESPSLAQATLITLVDLYQTRHAEVFAQASPEFFEARIVDLETQLAESENQLETFKAEHGISSLQNQKEVLLNQISALEGELGDTTAEAKGLAALVASIEQELADRPRMHELQRTSGLSHTSSDKLRETLTDLRLQEADLAARYTESYRPLQEVREQIAMIQSDMEGQPEFRTEVTVGLDANFEALKNRMENERAQLAGAGARLESLEGEIAGLKEQLAGLTALEIELNRRERNLELAEDEYRKYRKDLQEAQLAAALDREKVSNVRVAQAASRPLEPSSPKKLRNIGLGLLVGLFGGICLAFLAEFLDDTLNTIEGAERALGVPVLTSLSEKEFKACT